MDAHQGRFDHVALSEQGPQLAGHGFNQKFGVAHGETPVLINKNKINVANKVRI
jgi:hypothetical protein